MDLFAHREREFQVKLRRVRSLMQEKGIAALLITEAHNFSWLTGGGENFVFLARSGGAAPLLVTRDAVYLAADNIEAMRLFPEELEGLPIEDGSHMWYASREEIQDHYRKLASGPLLRDTDIETDLQRLHVPMLEDEIMRYRWLGKKAEEAIRLACQAARPGLSEFHVASMLSALCLEKKIWPVLILVAADERLRNYRHPLPTDKKIEREFMLVLCARRHGLIANVTRIVAFDGVSDDLRRKHEAVCRIDAELILSSRPGTTFGEALRRGIALYENMGYGDEWKLHHQGGPTGYLGRYFKALPDTREVVRINQAVAWNPSISGSKSEDTVLIADDGFEILTQAKNWPMLDVQTEAGSIQRADIYTPS